MIAKTVLIRPQGLRLGARASTCVDDFMAVRFSICRQHASYLLRRAMNNFTVGPYLLQK